MNARSIAHSLTTSLKRPHPLAALGLAALFLLGPGCDFLESEDDNAEANAETNAESNNEDNNTTVMMNNDSTVGSNNTATGNNNNNTTIANNNTTTTGNNNTTTTNNNNNNPMVGTWQEVSLPCDTRTDVLYFDDDGQTGFMGCGEGTNGTGLYVTRDGGETWEGQLEFEEVRVSGITRGPDELLYVAGKHTGKSQIVWKMDTTPMFFEPTTVLNYSGSAPFMRIGHAEEIAVTAEGRIMTDSLTGREIGYSENGTDFTELYHTGEETLDGNDLSLSIARIKAHNNQFFAVGSTINTPPEVYLPSKRSYEEGYYFQTIEVIPESEEESGEMRDFHVFSDEEMLAVGFNQTERTPIIARATGDLYDGANWSVLSKAGLANQSIVDSDLRSLSVQGDSVLAGGEKVPTSQGGILLLSEDRGATWTEIDISADTGKKTSTIWRVHLFADGRMFVAAGPTGYRNF